MPWRWPDSFFKEFDNILKPTDLLATRLAELATKNPHLNPDSKHLTKLNFKKWFKVEYYQALLELEAEQKYPHLCLAHWKADNMIGQAFLWQGDTECRHHRQGATSVLGSHNQSGLAPVPILVSSVVPINAAMCAFELSPGPKSPSALQAQKCSKDESQNSGQNKDILVAPSNGKSLHWSSNH